MREWVTTVSQPAMTVIDAIALLIILVGRFKALFKVVRAAIRLTHAG